MRIEQLEFLVEIEHWHSMKLAAEQLHISPQALSAAVKNVEKELNVPIFHRSYKGISLTKEGKYILAFAEETLARYRQLQEMIREEAGLWNASLKGSMTLYVAPIFVEAILPSYITKFKNKYPNISIELIQRNTLSISQSWDEKSARDTLGALIVPYDGKNLMWEYLPGKREAYAYKALNCNHYYACVPKDSPFAHQKTISIRKLLEYPIVDYCAGNAGTAPLIPLLKRYKPTFKISLTVSSISLWIEAIQNHMGIGFLNAIFAEEDSIVASSLSRLSLLRIKEPLVTFNCFVYAKNPTASVTAFLEEFPLYVPKKGEPEFIL